MKFFNSKGNSLNSKGIPLISKGESLIAKGNTLFSKGVPWISRRTSLISKDLSVRRLGRIIRIKIEDDETIKKVLESAVDSEVQIRQLKEYEPDLEDIFLLIMDKLGSEIKGSSELMTPDHKGGF